MATKKKEIQMERATVERVGYFPSNRTTVLYVKGQGISQGVVFKLAVDHGEYVVYEEEFTRSLKGREVEYSFNGVDGMRSPLEAKFISFVEED